MKDFIAFYTLLRREMRRIKRIAGQTVLSQVVTMSLYFIIFGKIIGSQIRMIDGVPYMEFIVPGLIIMSMITNSYNNTASSFFGLKFQGNIQEMLVSPISNLSLVMGLTLAGIARGLIVGFFVAVIAWFFSGIHVQHPLLMVIVAVLTGALFSLAGILNGIFANTFEDVMIIPSFVLAPLTFLGGVFYSVQQLPPLWQHIAMLNPIMNMVNAFRYSMLGVADTGVFTGMLILCVFTAVFFALCMYLLGRGVRIKP